MFQVLKILHKHFLYRSFCQIQGQLQLFITEIFHPNFSLKHYFIALNKWITKFQKQTFKYQSRYHVHCAEVVETRHPRHLCPDSLHTAVQ